MSLYRALLNRAVNRESGMYASVQRLYMLENAVINYGGGLAALLHRAEAQAVLLQTDKPEAALLLRDIAHYLHDVAETGQLDLTDKQTFRYERTR